VLAEQHAAHQVAVWQHGNDEFGLRYGLRWRSRRPGAALYQRLNRLRVHIKNVKLVALFQQILRHGRAHLS
jgi:hypothetical protein